MDDKKVRRGVYINPRQRKKLIELVTENPELISCKLTQDFTYRDSQKLWQSIANECNSLPGPGAHKTWRQWRKTWHDLRSNMKKRQQESGEVPTSVVTLTAAQQEALGLKNVTSTTNYQETTEFVPLDQDHSLELTNEIESAASFSEPDSPPEAKVFDLPKERKKIKNKSKHGTKDSNSCHFNCDSLAATEQRKLKMKEDYLNFKKDYLKQKLKLIREQTEALKCIAKEITK